MLRDFSYKTFLFSSLFFVNLSICMQPLCDEKDKEFFSIGSNERSIAQVLEIDTADINDVLKYIGSEGDGETVVVFDIDGVVMIPKQSIGSEQWAYYEINKFLEKFDDKKGSIDHFHEVWQLVQGRVEAKLVDIRLRDVLKKLEEYSIKVMGFTARGMYLIERTREQMSSKSVQVDFSKNAYCDYEVECPDYAYKNGILFINLGASKGEILKKFFDKVGKNPNKIIFIDNDKKNIVAMRDMCQREKLSFVGIRYGGADEISKLNDRKKKICDFQLDHLRKFNVILSDEKAEEELAKIS